MPALLKAPFIRFDLIGKAETIEGYDKLRENSWMYDLMRSSYGANVAQTVVDDYSDWDWDQSFGESDFLYATQLFLDRAFEKFNLPFKTEFSPNLKIVDK